MTDKNLTDEAPNSALLQQELKTLHDAPLMRRADAALRLARMTVAVLRRLEIRLLQLEAATDGKD